MTKKDNGHNQPTTRLAQPLGQLPAVGPRVAPLLNKLGLHTALDLLFFFPRDYEDCSELCAIGDLDDAATEHRQVSVSGTIDEVELRSLSNGRSVLGAVVRDDSSALRIVWFNQPFMMNRLVRGSRVLVSGKPRLSGLRWEMTHPTVRTLRDDETPSAGEIRPVYHLTEGLRQTQIRQIVRSVVESLAGELEEVLPASYRADRQLWGLSDALRAIHHPEDADQLTAARRRFVYQELLVLQLALAIRRWNLQHQRHAPALPATAKIDARIRRLFPFELTADQRQATNEIAQDMGCQLPMNRLLEGEVGSGKTVVAEYAMLLAVAHGYQAALMAPTEVLARQHLRVLSEDLRQSRVRIDLLTGAMPASRRRHLLAQLATGEIDLLIGTQALLHERVEFHRLGLVVIDEQHKFGVRQRASLRQAGLDPHYLIMTATPIPRTVTMALFGDLDVSVLRQTPPGRQAVHTYIASDDQREQWWQFFTRKLREGRQGYVVAPHVDDDREDQPLGVEQLFEQLVNGPLEAFRVDMLHGRMSTSEKEAIMNAYRSGRTHVLVATSVIEVGIDVPNATLMTIEGGERFGLAQLHQLRGRIRRGSFPGYLTVFAHPANEAARQRLEAFAGTLDGFELAEVDFQMRGPGDLLGTVQHGLPPFRIADLQRDAKLLQEARQDAQQLVADADAPFFQPEFASLKQRVFRRYGRVLDLADVA